MSLKENVADCFWGWNVMHDALKAIEVEIAGCGPDCSKEFHRMALVSVLKIATEARQKAVQGKSDER